MSLGLGYFERAKLSHKRRQVEKAKIGERLWIGWIESFVGQLRSLVNSVRWSSENNAHGEESGQVEKAKIGERLWIGSIESFVGQLRSLVNCVRWSIPFVGQERHVGEDRYDLAKSSVESFFITKTQYTDVTKDQYCFDFVKPLTHEKHCIQISKHVTNYGKIMHMEKKEDKWRKPRSVKGCG
ncbi:hypothetical protein T05_9960 [Trichinella murrelli]|uniref:Uncharacterized protein n=1 Tax=Trichinella murrelli TaxID=144512 RepID=A0A0V0T5K3_9BILA|nr:hypothetical protein T05_9960 [Trichinella murrelli]